VTLIGKEGMARGLIYAGRIGSQNRGPIHNRDPSAPRECFSFLVVGREHEIVDSRAIVGMVKGVLNQGSTEQGSNALAG
jgi:hypothetical protein